MVSLLILLVLCGLAFLLYRKRQSRPPKLGPVGRVQEASLVAGEDICETKGLSVGPRNLEAPSG